MSALNRSTGDYVMLMPISDCYNGMSWFQRCVEILDENEDISLVHGKSMEFNENYDTNISSVTNINFPSGKSFLPFWFARFFLYGELTYCVRRKVYKKCISTKLPGEDTFMKKQNAGESKYAFFNPDMKFSYNFNRFGYLSYFIPIVAGHVRSHPVTVSVARKQIDLNTAVFYTKKVNEYKEQIFKKKKIHSFRDGQGKVMNTIDGNKLKNLIKDVITYRMNAESFAFNYDDTLNLRFGNFISIIKSVTVFLIRNFIYYFYYNKYLFKGFK